MEEEIESNEKTIEVPFAFKIKETKYKAGELVTIRKLNWGPKHRLLEQCLKTKFKGTTPEPDIEVFQFRMQEISLNKCIVKASFPTDLEHIMEHYPDKLGNFLWKEIDGFQGLDAEKKDSGSSSGKDLQTPKEKPQSELKTAKQ